MAFENKNILEQIFQLAIFKNITQIVALGTIIWFGLVFVFNSKATNAEVPRLEQKFENHAQVDFQFQQSILIKMENVTVKINYLADELKRQNDLREIKLNKKNQNENN